LGFYVGLKEKSKPQVIESATEPASDVKANFDIIYGSFKSMEDAERYVRAMGELACGDADT
jgi:hypothetical protein